MKVRKDGILETRNVVGSVEVSGTKGVGSVLAQQDGIWNTASLLSELPAGDNLIGSVIIQDPLNVLGSQAGVWDINSLGSLLSELPAGNNLLGSVIIADGGGAITVDATNLDIRDLTKASDSVEGSITSMPTTSVVGSVEVSNIGSTFIFGEGTGIGVDTDGSQLLVTGSVNIKDQPINVLGSQAGVWDVNSIGSILSELPAGNNLLGSVVVSDGGGSLTVDGTVAATQSGNWNVGSVLSQLPAGSNILGSIVISDGGGSISIDDGGNTITVDGTVTADAGDGIGSVLASQDGIWNTASILSELPVGNNIIGSVIIPSPVNVGSIESELPTGTNNIGSVDIEQPLPAGTQLLGSVVISDGGGAITVDGTVTADAGAGVGSVLAAQDGNWNMGSILSQLPTGTNNIGSVTVESTVVWEGVGSIIPSTLDSSDRLPVKDEFVGIGHGSKVVATAGTDEALAGATTVRRVIIQSFFGNIGLIAIGSNGVDATEASGVGILLRPGDSLDVSIDDLADIRVDSSEDGEGVRFTYFT